jgi:hypothetical protein
MTVSVVRFDGSLDSLRRAIELCNGFEQLDSNRRILIKPNNCFRHPIMPPYGMVTTSTITELIVQLLLEHGCRDISIGEGAIIGIFDELEPYTNTGCQIMGLYGQVKESRWAALQGRFERYYQTCAGLSLAGGSSEIMKNIICLLGLGLPRSW